MDDKDFITRLEYEARNSLNQAEINKLETKIDNLLVKIDTLNTQLENRINGINNNVNSKISAIRIAGWKYIATSLVSFLMGGGALGLIEFLIRK